MDTVRVRSTLGYLTAYLVTVYVGRLTVPDGAGLALFWPAAGVGVLWMLRAKTTPQLRVDAATLFAGTFVLDLGLDVGPTGALLLAGASLLQSLAVRLLVAHLQRAPGGVPLRAELVSLRGMVILLAASVVAATLSSPIGAIVGWRESGDWSGSIQLAWVIRNACGIFVIAAAVLVRATTLRNRDAIRAQGRSLLTGGRRRHVGSELVALSVVSAVAVALVYAPGQQLPLTFGVLLCSAWAGFRFTPIVAMAHTACVGTAALVATMYGWGPIGAVADVVVRADVMQFYIAVTALLVMLLALGVQERQALTSEVQASEAESTARADLLDAVTTAMSDGLLVLAADGSVRLINPAAAALTATLDDSAPTGAYGLRTIDGHPLPAEELPHVRLLRGEPVPPMDLLHTNAFTGEQRVLSVNTTAMHNQDERDTAVLVIRDVTNERIRERETQGFAGVVAHDLRTPIGAMKMTLEGCEEKLETMPGDVTSLRTSLIQMYTAADAMEHLILDLLAFAQAQSIVLEPTELSLGAVIDDICRELAVLYPGQQPVVEHSGLDTVVADPTLVRQLLANLLGNAVKYVAPGTRPWVRVESQRMGDMVEVRVSDNGIGIPEDARGRIFESFYRAAGGEYAGTGLGLAICARTVERHGGRIGATVGVDGVGTTMVFTLPGADQRERRTTSADPPPRRTGSETAVS